MWLLRIYPHESKAATSNHQVIDSVCDPEMTDSGFMTFCSDFLSDVNVSVPGWKYLFLSFTCSTESMFTTGSFSYRRDGKQQEKVTSETAQTLGSSHKITGFQQANMLVCG